MLGVAKANGSAGEVNAVDFAWAAAREVGVLLRLLHAIFVVDVAVVVLDRALIARVAACAPLLRAGIFVAVVFITETLLEASLEVLGADVGTAVSPVIASVPSSETASIATESAAKSEPAVHRHLVLVAAGLSVHRSGSKKRRSCHVLYF